MAVKPKLMPCGLLLTELKKSDAKVLEDRIVGFAFGWAFLQERFLCSTRCQKCDIGSELSSAAREVFVQACDHFWMAVSKIVKEGGWKNGYW